MKKGVILLLAWSLLAISLFNFISAAEQTILIDTNTGEAGVSKTYNISVSNIIVPANVNFTQINITVTSGFTLASYNTDTNATITNPFANILVFTNNSVSLINSSTYPGSRLGYFWFNMIANQIGLFNITVTTLDSSLITNSTNITITISDTVAPVIAFVSPTPSNNADLDHDYIPFNVSADDSGSGVKNVIFYVYNSTALVSSQADTSSPFFYNFTSLDDGTYYINATAYDNSNNNASTSIRTIDISVGISCTSSWSCSWTECTNGTQTQTNCVDANSCGFIAPAGTQACESCVSNWDCGDWSPAACSGDSNQTRLCTDLNSCEAPDTQTRSCVVGGTSTANASGLSIFSSSTLFFVILGIIVASVLGVIIFLIRLKKKSSSTNSGNSDSGYSVYSPPRGPPALPPSGYANSPRAYPNQPQNY